MTREYMDPARRGHFVYRAYDAEGRLLYVGCTMNPEKRWREHSRPLGSDWAPFAARFRMAGPYNYDTARALERQALRTEKPWFGDTPAKQGQRNLQRRSIDRHMRRLMHETGQAWDAVITEAIAFGERDFPTPRDLDTYLTGIALARIPA